MQAGTSLSLSSSLCRKPQILLRFWPALRVGCQLLPVGPCSPGNNHCLGTSLPQDKILQLLDSRCPSLPFSIWRCFEPAQSGGFPVPQANFHNHTHGFEGSLCGQAQGAFSPSPHYKMNSLSTILVHFLPPSADQGFPGWCFIQGAGRPQAQLHPAGQSLPLNHQQEMLFKKQRRVLKPLIASPQLLTL